MTDRVLTSSKNPHVKGVLGLRRRQGGRGRAQAGRFVAEGYREVTRALDAGLVMAELYWCEGMGEGLGEKVARLKGRGVGGEGGALCFAVTEGLMRAMAYRENPEGVLGVFEERVWDLDDFDEVGSGSDGGAELWLVGVGVEKPGNVGAMARCAQGAGCRGLLIADGGADVFNPNCIRASTGAVFSLPVVAGSTDAIAGFLRGRGVRLVVATPGGERVYTGVEMAGATAVVVGAEDRGVTEAWLALVREEGNCAVRIPMAGGGVDSLNTSVAGAVLLYEAVRQRGVV